MHRLRVIQLLVTIRKAISKIYKELHPLHQFKVINFFWNPLDVRCLKFIAAFKYLQL